jgi:hypothetical protein
MMKEEHAERIAKALERIAKSMEAATEIASRQAHSAARDGGKP